MQTETMKYLIIVTILCAFSLVAEGYASSLQTAGEPRSHLPQERGSLMIVARKREGFKAFGRGETYEL